jgi:hypothetical protein
MMPSTGQIYKLNNIPCGFEFQIGEGEREGADSGRPEYEARVLLQFQLDKAPAVPPAQVLWTACEGRRTSITTALAPFGGEYSPAQEVGLSGTSFQRPGSMGGRIWRLYQCRSSFVAVVQRRSQGTQCGLAALSSRQQGSGRAS